MDNPMPEIMMMLFGFLLGGSFMFWGARTAKIENISFRKITMSVFACIACILFVIIDVIIFRGIFLFSGITVAIIGFIILTIIVIYLQIYSIKNIFKTTTNKAVVTWIFIFIAQIIIVASYLMIFWDDVSTFPGQN
jgi:hypothetical protein